MASPDVRLYPRKDTGMWCVDVRWPKTRARVRHSLGVPIDQDPAAAFEEWRKEILPGIIRDHAERPPAAPQTQPGARDAGPKLRDIFGWYIDQYLPHKAEPASEKTIHRYQQILDDFLMFCRGQNIGRVRQISPETIRQWQTWMQQHRPARGGGGIRSASTKRDEILVVQRSMTTAIAQGKLDAMPFVTWDKPKAKPGTRYKAHSLELLKEILELVRVEKPTIYPIISWLAVTGWSPEDGVDLRWEQLDLRRGTKDVRRMKNGNPYPALMTPEELGILQELARQPHQPNDYVFPLPVAPEKSKNLHKARTEYTSKHLKRVVQKHLGVKVTLRDLRKTFGTLHASGAFGTPTMPKELQELMAHSSLETTMTYYYDVPQERLRERASVGGAAILGQKSTENPVSRETRPKKDEK